MKHRDTWTINAFLREMERSILETVFCCGCGEEVDITECSECWENNAEGETIILHLCRECTKKREEEQ